MVNYGITKRFLVVSSLNYKVNFYRLSEAKDKLFPLKSCYEKAKTCSYFTKIRQLADFDQSQ